MGDEPTQAVRTDSIQVDGRAARHHPVHHQPVAESGVARLKDFLAQDAAMGVDQRVGGVVADEAEVVDVVRDPLELGQERTQPVRPWRRLRAGGSLGGTGEGQGVGDGAVARDAALAVKRKWPGSMIPACTGPTGI